MRSGQSRAIILCLDSASSYVLSPESFRPFIEKEYCLGTGYFPLVSRSVAPKSIRDFFRTVYPQQGYLVGKPRRRRRSWTAWTAEYSFAGGCFSFSLGRRRRVKKYITGIHFPVFRFFVFALSLSSDSRKGSTRIVFFIAHARRRRRYHENLACMG